MYLGKMMELTSSEELYDNPLHPYTRALLSAIPIPDPPLSGSVSAPFSLAIRQARPIHPKAAGSAHDVRSPLINAISGT